MLCCDGFAATVFGRSIGYYGSGGGGERLEVGRKHKVRTDGPSAVREHPLMTSANFSDFLTPLSAFGTDL